MQAHIKRISAPLTFVDMLVDVVETRILPGYEWIVEKIRIYYPIALDYVKSQGKIAMTKIEKNETCQMIWLEVVKYYEIALNWYDIC